MAARLKKGDTVLVLSGKDRGKKHKIIRVLRDADRYVVEGVNLAKRHRRASQKFQGGIVDLFVPLPGSKLTLVCPRCNAASRVGFRLIDDKKVRSCKKCGEIIDRM
ncbi:MAG: 50S ribosomal protein L24 [Candidatus Margulisiibacteriota bacterium]